MSKPAAQSLAASGVASRGSSSCCFTTTSSPAAPSQRHQPHTWQTGLKASCQAQLISHYFILILLFHCPQWFITLMTKEPMYILVTCKHINPLTLIMSCFHYTLNQSAQFPPHPTPQKNIVSPVSNENLAGMGDFADI